jgi:hypothetical protein
LQTGIPENITPGVYFVRIIGGQTSSYSKLMVIE